jgi:hypothetical protein
MIRSGKLTLEDIEKAKMKFTRVERSETRLRHGGATAASLAEN